MRPRGESISTWSSRYVGHAFRHSPQCTHRSRSDCCGLSKAVTSDAAIQPAAVQETLRIEHLLDLLHHRKIVSWLRPQLPFFAKFRRRKLNHAGARLRMSQGIVYLGGPLEVAITNA